MIDAENLRYDIITLMSSTTGSPSGRFVLRLPPTLHATLRAAAERAGLSLNEYCVHVLAAPGPDPVGPGATVAIRASEAFGRDLVGVLVHGSWTRGEATVGSDIDVLVVLEAARPITRALYREWDRTPLEHYGHPVEVHFVAMPSTNTPHGSVWLEVALDGVVAFDREGRVARLLSKVRRGIAAGEMTRRRAHGQPYWTASS